MLQFPYRRTFTRTKKKKKNQPSKKPENKRLHSYSLQYNGAHLDQCKPSQSHLPPWIGIPFNFDTDAYIVRFNHKKKCTYKTINMLDSKANGYDDLFRVIFGMPLPPNPPTTYFYAYVIGLSRCAPQKCFHQTISVIFCYFWRLC